MSLEKKSFQLSYERREWAGWSDNDWGSVQNASLAQSVNQLVYMAARKLDLKWNIEHFDKWNAFLCHHRRKLLTDKNDPFFYTTCMVLPHCMHCMQCGLATRKLSVCLAVLLSNAWFVTKLKKVVPIFSFHMKDHSSYFNDKKNGWWGLPLLPEILGQSGTKTPLFNRYLLVAPQL